jgi:hypothetical protein
LGNGSPLESISKSQQVVKEKNKPTIIPKANPKALLRKSTVSPENI